MKGTVSNIISVGLNSVFLANDWGKMKKVNTNELKVVKEYKVMSGKWVTGMCCDFKNKIWLADNEGNMTCWDIGKEDVDKEYGKIHQSPIYGIVYVNN